MTRISLAFAVCILLASCSSKTKSNNAKYVDNESKIDSIMALMTMEEKIGQMTQIDQQFLVKDSHISKYGIGSLLSGGGSTPDVNEFSSWADMYDNFQSIALGSRFILGDH